MNPTLLVVLVVIIAFFFLMTWRNNRKRRRDEEEKSAKLTQGAEVMTNFGLFGTVHSIDNDNNKIVLEVSPGTLVTVHRQTIARIDTPADASADEPAASAIGSVETTSSAIDAANAQAQAEAAKTAQQPQFGERITPTNKNDE